MAGPSRRFHHEWGPGGRRRAHFGTAGGMVKRSKRPFGPPSVCGATQPPRIWPLAGPALAGRLAGRRDLPSRGRRVRRDRHWAAVQTLPAVQVQLVPPAAANGTATAWQMGVRSACTVRRRGGAGRLSCSMRKSRWAYISRIEVWLLFSRTPRGLRGTARQRAVRRCWPSNSMPTMPIEIDAVGDRNCGSRPSRRVAHPVRSSPASPTASAPRRWRAFRMRGRYRRVPGVGPSGPRAWQRSRLGRSSSVVEGQAVLGEQLFLFHSELLGVDR